MVPEKRSIALDSDMVRKVEELAKKESRSFSNMIHRILEEYCKKLQEIYQY
ncbi:MAG: ribbon-helix-helix protein, CopG family [Candidatus Aerophobus sp.]|nr:MAG: ribbon-helix-helix protein, CopG family [Candidatus Aerophobus sp.]